MRKFEPWPCTKECENRHARCHAECEAYLEYWKKYVEPKNKHRNERQADQLLMDGANRAIAKRHRKTKLTGGFKHE